MGKQEDTPEREQAEEKPRQTRSGSGEDKFAKGTVDSNDLQRGTTDSDSIRRLQHRLGQVEGIPQELKPEVTGNWDGATTNAVRWWQNNHGYEGGRGRSLSAEQAEKLFGEGYSINSK